MKVSILQTSRFRPFLEINNKKWQYGCLKCYVTLQNALFLAAFCTLTVVPANFLMAANYEAGSLTFVML